MGLPDSSVSKESACNAGDPILIPGWEDLLEKDSLQYSWASLVAQLVKNPPPMLETLIQSLGWEYPQEKGKTTHGEFHGLYSPYDHKELDMTK